MDLFTDVNGKFYNNGQIIDLHQTVNGQNLFYIDNLKIPRVLYMNTDSLIPLDKEYEYDVHDLLRPNQLGHVEIEIINDNYDYLAHIQKKRAKAIRALNKVKELDVRINGYQTAEKNKLLGVYYKATNFLHHWDSVFHEAVKNNIHPKYITYTSF